jgi:chromosome partitioning protein
MQTIVLTTQKGGSGKSTLAISLTLAAIRAGHNVRLIETDPQGTVSNWKRRRPYAAPIVEPIYAARELEQRLQSLAQSSVTVTIVDTAGGETAATNSAIRYSDFCLIPTRPSIADIEATAATLRVIRAWHKPFAYVLNQTPIRAAARLAGADRCQTLYRDAQRSPGRAERRPRRLRTCAARQVRGGNARPLAVGRIAAGRCGCGT